MSILDDIRIATPCEANWDEMPGDDRARHCSLCSRSVYNIAAMTSSEATTLITNREGRLCARLFQRADGTLVTADCPAPEVEASPVTRPRSRFRRVHAFALVFVALSVACMGRGAGESPPSGPGVTLDDWVQWAGVTLGLRPAPTSAPVLRPTITMGDSIY